MRRFLAGGSVSATVNIRTQRRRPSACGYMPPSARHRAKCGNRRYSGAFSRGRDFGVSFANSRGLVSHFWLVARWALRGLYMRGFSRGGAAKIFRPAFGHRLQSARPQSARPYFAAPILVRLPQQFRKTNVFQTKQAPRAQSIKAGRGAACGVSV